MSYLHRLTSYILLCSWFQFAPPSYNWIQYQVIVKVKVKLTLRLTVSQSVSLGVKPHLGFMTRYVLLFDSYGLVLWGAFSDKMVGLSFIYAAGPCQHSLSWVQVPWDLWSHFIFSDLRLSFSSTPTTCSHSGGIWPRLHMGNWMSLHSLIL
jgi:hypothetical protein